MFPGDGTDRLVAMVGRVSAVLDGWAERGEHLDARQELIEAMQGPPQVLRNHGPDQDQRPVVPRVYVNLQWRRHGLPYDEENEELVLRWIRQESPFGGRTVRRGYVRRGTRDRARWWHRSRDPALWIHTFHGWVPAVYGDTVMLSPGGDFYPADPRNMALAYIEEL